MIGLFFTGFALSISLCLDIGIANMTIIQTGLFSGFWRSLMVGIGSAFGDLIYAILSFTVLSWFLNHLIIQYVLWALGTILLTYLTVHMAKSAFHPKPLHAMSMNLRPNHAHALALGLTLALSSPSAVLWFASVGGSVIAADANHQSFNRILIFCSGFFVAGCLWSFAVAYVSSRVRRFVNDTSLRVVSLCSSGLMLYFACHVFFSGLSRLFPSLT